MKHGIKVFIKKIVKKKGKQRTTKVRRLERDGQHFGSEPVDAGCAYSRKTYTRKANFSLTNIPNN